MTIFRHNIFYDDDNDVFAQFGRFRLTNGLFKGTLDKVSIIAIYIARISLPSGSIPLPNTSSSRNHISYITPLKLAQALTSKKYAANVASGSTSVTITAATHGLGTSGDFDIQVKELSTGEYVECGIITNNTTGLVTLSFNVAPTLNQYRVIISL